MTDLDTLREKLEKIRRHPHIAGLMMVEVCNALPALLDELEKLRIEREELRRTLEKLVDACLLADAHEELSGYVDGSLLDEARERLAAGEQQP